jgi:hypothetical protein
MRSDKVTHQTFLIDRVVETDVAEAQTSSSSHSYQAYIQAQLLNDTPALSTSHHIAQYPFTIYLYIAIET